MKLRLRPGSIRLRLRKADVEALLHSGRCERDVMFGPSSENRLMYALQLDERTTASFRSNQIVVTVARPVALQWARTEQVGIEVIQQTDGPPLHILIEKDFACIDGDSQESQDDAFPNPVANCGPTRD